MIEPRQHEVPVPNLHHSNILCDCLLENVEIANSIDNRMLDIKSGKAQYTVPFMDSEKFPKIRIPFPEDFICVKGLNSVIKRTIFATDNAKETQAERKSLQFVKLSFTNGQTKAEATSRLIRATNFSCPYI